MSRIVLTGGPGSGKTSVIENLSDMIAGHLVADLNMMKLD